MAKKTKKVKESSTKIFKEFIDKSIGIFASVLEKNINIVEWVKNLVNIKAKIRKYMFASLLAVAGVTVLLIGLASYINSLMPGLANGLSEIIVGVVVIIISLVIYKMSR
jgi:hypothetical protein